MHLRGAIVVGAALIVGTLLAPPRPGHAQVVRGGTDEQREQQFVETLRREDPAEAERWLALQDARGRALVELREAENQYGAAGPALRPLALPRLTQARRKYVESATAVLDFLDARDRRIVGNYQDAIKEINGLIEGRRRARADLEKMR